MIYVIYVCGEFLNSIEIPHKLFLSFLHRDSNFNEYFLNIYFRNARF